MVAKWLPRLHVPCPRMTYPKQAGGDGLAPPQTSPTCIEDETLSHKPLPPGDSFYTSWPLQTNSDSPPGVVHLNHPDWEGTVVGWQPTVFTTGANETHSLGNLSQETWPGFVVSSQADGK